MRIEPGCSTAFPFNVRYRIGRIAKYVDGGSWLDYGCADGGYTASLLQAGAAAVVGVDVAADRVESAKIAHPDLTFHQSNDVRELFAPNSFDGAFMNEVFEHVEDETRTLEELHTVLKPRGVLVVISPNRGFPLEGHTVHIGEWSSSRPTPFIPWFPRSVTDPWVSARNYWPRELRKKVSASGFSIVETGYIMPVFEGYPWLPDSVIARFRRHISRIDRLPLVKCFGVSNLVVALRS